MSYQEVAETSSMIIAAHVTPLNIGYHAFCRFQRMISAFQNRNWIQWRIRFDLRGRNVLNRKGEEEVKSHQCPTLYPAMLKRNFIESLLCLNYLLT